MIVETLGYHSTIGKVFILKKVRQMMQPSVAMRIPNEGYALSIPIKSLGEIVANYNFAATTHKDMSGALTHMLNNAMKYAYESDEKGTIEVEITPLEIGLRIDVRDRGLPLSRDNFDNHKHTKMSTLVDRYYYTNLGKNGKQFTAIKYLPHELKSNEPFYSNINQNIAKNSNILIDDIEIREYKSGDEESISRLIYNNYSHSYYKELFYYPVKIAEKIKNGDIFSVVALHNSRVVGHFATVMESDSNIGEVAIVVVHSNYKGIGIMNKMFDMLIEQAKKNSLFALFGEALTMHTYSQKSNLSHGFCESALMLGEVPSRLHFKNESEQNRRTAVVIGYKILIEKEHSIYLPKRYMVPILQAYSNAKIEPTIETEKLPNKKNSKFKIKHDVLLETVTIVVLRYGKDFKERFMALFRVAEAKHPDMVFADINLERISAIDSVVKKLNKMGFFYAGVLFFKHKNRDFLRLQYTNSLSVEKRKLAIYTDDMKRLLALIRSDEKKVGGAINRE